MRHAHAFVYGPVPSRRLGASLGVDVVPPKACPYDCTYCQLGPTRTMTTDRALFFPVDEVVRDVHGRLKLWPPPDTITVAGSGEPTLYSGLGDLIDGIKGISSTRVALLTNGALFYRDDVRAEAARADLVLPSLDAGDEATFHALNRPAPGLFLEKVVDGLAAFRRQYDGQIWLEVMVVAGVNDSASHLRSLARLVRRIAPNRVQLNTPVRPTFDEAAAPVAVSRLRDVCELFTPVAEVIPEPPAATDGAEADSEAGTAELLSLLHRRPCTASDVSVGLGLHPNSVIKALAKLERDGTVHRVLRDGRVYWHAIGQHSRSAGRLAQ